MTEKRFTVHIKWFNYEKTEGEIELFDNGQPLLLSEDVEDVQYIKTLLNGLYEENQQLRELLEYGLEVSQVEIDEELRRIKND